MTRKEPSKGTVEAFQNAMSPEQRELQKSILPILKEAFPNLVDSPGHMSLLAGMAAQGKPIPVEMLPGKDVTFRDPETGQMVTKQLPLNYLASNAAVNLEFRKINAQYANLQAGQLRELLSTPSKVMVPGPDGKMMPLPMSMARDAQMIEESMERIRTSKLDIKNIDALVTLMKSTQLRPEDRSVALETLARQLGFKSMRDDGFINWLKDYNQWRLLPPAPGEPQAGAPPAGVPPAGLPRQR